MPLNGGLNTFRRFVIGLILAVIPEHQFYYSMHHKYLSAFFACLCWAFSCTQLHAQHIVQPYSYSFYQKLNKVYYHPDQRLHTSIKPYAIDEMALPLYDSLMERGVKDRGTWIERKIFNEHLFDVKKEDFTFFADFIPDFQIGRDFAGSGKTLWLNTRGFQAGGTVGDKFYFYTSGYENQGVFPEYIDNYINEHRVVPGQMYGKIGKKVQDWAYVSAIVSYAASKKFNVTLAYDKTHIGDGYRSMLLSDQSSNYTSLKFSGELGDVAYLSQWSYMLDPLKGVPDSLGNPPLGSPSKNKWGAFQYVDWNVDSRFSIGFFNAVLWGASSDTLSSDVEVSAGFGLNARYKVLDNMALYGQASYYNKMGAQLGLRGYDLFGLKDLNYLAEYNMAVPYAYGSEDVITGYTNYSEPLAHPLGGNFNEIVGKLNYSYKRFDFALQGNYASHGLDPKMSTENYGGNPLRPIEDEMGSEIGQGVSTDLLYGSGTIAYILNPKYNLRVEAGARFRQEKNSIGKNTSGMFIFGLRASFRDFHYDF